MQFPLIPSLAAGAVLMSATVPALCPLAQDDQTAEMAAMMETARAFTQPGEHHRLLERMIGEFDTETRFFFGDQPTPASKGTATTSWLMDGRWIKTESKGSMMGQEVETFTVMGYDNFKQSYVSTTVSSMDTAMNSSEGDLDPGGDVLLLYGTLDEYLTGEHDKMVKTVIRFLSDDERVMEIHDLPIGEKNTKVVEVRFKRKS